MIRKFMCLICILQMSFISVAMSGEELTIYAQAAGCFHQDIEKDPRALMCQNAYKACQAMQNSDQRIDCKRKFCNNRIFKEKNESALCERQAAADEYTMLNKLHDSELKESQYSLFNGLNITLNVLNLLISLWSYLFITAPPCASVSNLLITGASFNNALGEIKQNNDVKDKLSKLHEKYQQHDTQNMAEKPLDNYQRELKEKDLQLVAFNFILEREKINFETILDRKSSLSISSTLYMSASISALIEFLTGSYFCTEFSKNSVTHDKRPFKFSLVSDAYAFENATSVDPEGKDNEPFSNSEKASFGLGATNMGLTIGTWLVWIVRLVRLKSKGLGNIKPARLSAVSRMFTAGIFNILTYFMQEALDVEYTNSSKRMMYLIGLISKYESYSIPQTKNNFHLSPKNLNLISRPHFAFSKESLSKTLDFLFPNAWANKSNQLGENSGIGLGCLADQGMDKSIKIDENCSCQKNNSCLQIKNEHLAMLPKSLLNNPQFAKSLKMSNGIMNNSLRLDEIDSLDLALSNGKIKELHKETFAKVNKALLEKGQKPLPPISKLIRPEFEKIVTNLKKESSSLNNSLAFNQFIGDSNQRKNGPSQVEKLANEIIKKTPELESSLFVNGSLPESKKDKNSVSLLSNPGDLKNIEYPQNGRKYKVDSVNKNTDLSLWEIISNKYLKSFFNN